MRFDTDSIQILTIRFKRHAIWTEITKSWLKLNTHSHYSLLSQILSSNVWFYPPLMYARKNSLSVINLLSGEALNGEINAGKSAAPKMEIPMGTFEPIKVKYVCLSLFVVSGFEIWFEIWSLRIQDFGVRFDSRFEIGLEYLNLQWRRFEILEWDLIWDLPAHHCTEATVEWEQWAVRTATLWKTVKLQAIRRLLRIMLRELLTS